MAAAPGGQVRKPYTITKQRERWSDEEHGRFLEALKLYGRAWRRIEGRPRSRAAVHCLVAGAGCCFGADGGSGEAAGSGRG